MVTKLSDTVIDTQEETNYRYLPGLTSGLTVYFEDGIHVDDADGIDPVLQRFSNITFTLTDNTTNYIIMNHDNIPSTLEAVTVLPEEPHLMYTIVTASGSVSSVTDYRWKVVSNRLLASFGNTLYAEQLNDADHHWQFKDFTTPEFEDIDFIDDGTSSSPVNLTGTATINVGTNVPGATRGNPYEPGVSMQNGSGLENTAATVVNQLANTATGALGCWIKPTEDMATFSANRYTIMMQRFSNNFGLSVGWAIEPNGALYGWVDSGANQVYYTTAAGAVTPGEWNFVVFSQPGDGNGCKFYVDGSLVTTTPTAGGTGANDDWLDRLYTDHTTATNFYLLSVGIPGATSTILPCRIFSPFVYESAITAQKISDIHDAASRDRAASDVRTWILDNINPYVWNSMSFTGSTNQCSSLGSKKVQFQGSGTLTQATGPWTDTAINHFHNNAQTFSGAGNPTFFPSGNPNMDNNTSDIVGTWGAWVRTPSALTTARRFVSAGANFLAMAELGMNASGQFYATVQRSSGNAHLLTATGITLSANTWYFVAMTQDNSAGLKLYIDGAEVTGGNLTTSTTGTGTSTDWHNAIPAWTTDSSIRISGGAGSSSVGNWGNGRIADFFYHDAALTATQISNMHNAANGVFV